MTPGTSAPPAPPPSLVSLLEESIDLYLGDGFDIEQPDPFSWMDENLAESVAAAKPNGARLFVMPSPATSIAIPEPPKRSLREHVNLVDYIACSVEALDNEELTEEVRRELTAQLLEAMAGTREKVDSTARVLAMFQGFQAAAKAERERLQKREAYFGRQIDRIETYVIAILETSKLDRIEGDTNTLALRKNPPAVIIDDAAAIPAEYMRTPPPPAAVPDKVAIKRALAAKKAVAGARLDQGVQLVRS